MAQSNDGIEWKGDRENILLAGLQPSKSGSRFVLSSALFTLVLEFRRSRYNFYVIFYLARLNKTWRPNPGCRNYKGLCTLQ